MVKFMLKNLKKGSLTGQSYCRSSEALYSLWMFKLAFDQLFIRNRSSEKLAHLSSQRPKGLVLLVVERQHGDSLDVGHMLEGAHDEIFYTSGSTEERQPGHSTKS